MSRMSLMILAGLASCSALAQTKISGSLQCTRPQLHNTVQVADRTPHEMVISQRSCDWSKPLSIEGVNSKDDVLSLFTDKQPDRARDHGYNIISMSNGDKVFMHYRESVESKGRNASSGAGTFVLSGGTGKFQGIYGRGTLASQRGTTGTMTVQIEGEYTLPK